MTQSQDEPAHRSWNLWGSQRGFVEAYNLDRHEENDWTNSLAVGGYGSRGESRAVSRMQSRSPSRMLSRSSSFILPPPVRAVGDYLSKSTRPFGDYCYTVVKSDVDDEPDAFLHEELPQVPHVEGRIPEIKHVQAVLFTSKENEEEATVVLTQNPLFQMISGCVILLSALFIGLETDLKWGVFFWVENAILGFFCFELYLQLRALGCWEFFFHEEDWRWNLFDFFIVACGVGEHWCLPLVQAMFHLRQGEKSTIFLLLSIGRILRLARLLKLFHIIRPLYNLAIGVSNALHGMFWVMILLAMALYVTAILSVYFIGQGNMLQQSHEDGVIAKIVNMFQTVESSMFALFGILIGWSMDPLEALFEEVPMFKPFFVLFYVYSAWAMLAVMSGVVSDNMIALRDAIEKEHAKQDRYHKDTLQRLLLDFFTRADTDNSGTISKDEFELMLKMPELTKSRVLKNASLSAQDLADLFHWIDHNGSGSISIDEFMASFKWLSQAICQGTIVKAQDRFMQEFKQIRTGLLQTMQKRYDEVLPLLIKPLDKVNAIKLQLQHLDMSLMNLRKQVDELNSQVFTATPKEVKAAQDRMSMKLKEVTRRLDIIDQRERSRRSSKKTQKAR